MRTGYREDTIKGQSTIWSPPVEGREYRLDCWGRPGYVGHINSYFALGCLLPPFTRCPPSPSPATPSTPSKLLCTVPIPSFAKRAFTKHAPHRPQSLHRRRDHLAGSSSRNPRVVTCACVSTDKQIMRLYLCLASADPSRAGLNCPSPKVSSLSLSVCVSRPSAR
jgi:hypothetical protein